MVVPSPAPESAVPTPSPPAAPRRSPRSWALWSNPVPVVAYVLAVQVLAVVLTGALVADDPVRLADVGGFLLLAAGTMAHVEVTRRVELREVRAALARSRIHVALTAMWTFAGLLLLPVGLALALIAVESVHGSLRNARRAPAFRCAFGAAAVVLATVAARSVLELGPAEGLLRGVGGPVALVVLTGAALVRWMVELLANLVLDVAGGRGLDRRVDRPGDAMLALGALGLGIALAAIAVAAPWLVLVVLAPLAAVQRGSLLGPLAHAARTDGKTGLCTAAHWRVRADEQMARARRRQGRFAVLMIDLDHFKSVNDRWGHLAGDDALQAVAVALARDLRREDVACRFGGEEFAVLLPGADTATAAATAERLRHRVHDVVVALGRSTSSPTPAALDAGRGATGERAPTGETARRAPDGEELAVRNLSVSIGVAGFPVAAADLDGLLVAADSACYRAKRDGRDRVRVAAAVTA